MLHLQDVAFWVVARYVADSRISGFRDVTLIAILLRARDDLPEPFAWDDLSAPFARSHDAEQRQEEEGTETPADDHDDHHERAEMSDGDEHAEAHRQTGGERRYGGHGDGRTDRVDDFLRTVAPVLRRGDLVADTVVDAEVDRQSHGQTDDDRIEQRDLPVEQHERRQGHDDRQRDRQHRVERDDDVQRSEEQHQESDAD